MPQTKRDVRRCPKCKFESLSSSFTICAGPGLIDAHLPTPIETVQVIEAPAVEERVALYRWRLSADSPWRLTDWEGVPDDIEETSDLERVDYVPAPDFIREENP